MTPTILITLIALAASILPQCSDQAVPHTGAQTEQAVPVPPGPQTALAQILAELDSPTDSAGAPPSLRCYCQTEVKPIPERSESGSEHTPEKT